MNPPIHPQSNLSAKVAAFLPNAKIIKMHISSKKKNGKDSKITLQTHQKQSTMLTRVGGERKNKFYLHEVVLQENLLSESIKTDTKADSHKGDIANILKR